MIIIIRRTESSRHLAKHFTGSIQKMTLLGSGLTED